MSTAPDTDTLLELLSDWRRRHLLYALQTRRCITVETLLEDVYGVDRIDAAHSANEGEHRSREQRTSLLHNHLPRLADEGIIEYDPRNQDIVRGPRFESTEPLLDTMRRYDTAAETRAPDGENDHPASLPGDGHER